MPYQYFLRLVLPIHNRRMMLRHFELIGDEKMMPSLWRVIKDSKYSTEKGETESCEGKKENLAPLLKQRKGARLPKQRKLLERGGPRWKWVLLAGNGCCSPEMVEGGRDWASSSLREVAVPLFVQGLCFKALKTSNRMHKTTRRAAFHSSGRDGREMHPQ